MPILYDEKQKIFTLQTAHSTYQMQADQYGFLLHLYYGNKTDGCMDYLIQRYDRGFSGNPYEAGEDRTYSMDVLPQEYPCQGNGDFRSVCLAVRGESGVYSCDLRYKSHTIYEGKYQVKGLPAIYEGENHMATLEILMEDVTGKLQVTLYYGVLEEYDIITRSQKIVNCGKDKVYLEKAATACVDFLYGNYDMIQFYGRHAMEQNLQRMPVGHGASVIGSRRGASSHQYNPFLIIADEKTGEDWGDCYGLSLIYSGNFSGLAEKDQFDQTRILLGIQDELFSYGLSEGEKFCTPEVALSYSSKGLTQLSHNYHKAYRRNLCRSRYKTEPRPVLINNWEATYYDFTGEKIAQIAARASALGVEMLVLDDGWFGKRDTDKSGLGDWFVNEEKLKGSLHNLAEKINGYGMKFGIWVEPEMVSEDSCLYREHPDWAFTVPGKKPVRSRSQLVLDFSRKDVREHIFSQICKVLDSANIEYMKWDMNRSITDVYSAYSGSASQGEVLHKYILGVYDFLEQLTARYPNLLIESCSGGGGRFDAGMLYYTPQIWCSDNTDAMDRIRIQYGTSFGYPISAVGSHVSAVPNHQTGRTVPMETRGVVAMAGSFGYELDLNQITEKEAACVRKQIQEYHKYWNVIHNGSYYRLTDPFADCPAAAWAFVTEDKKEALLNVVTLQSHGNQPVNYIRLKGLDPHKIYKIQDSRKQYRGSALMTGGLPVPYMPGEYQSWQVHLIEPL